jgi:GMP synthase (glutamine-hydrolysing)
MIQHRRSAVALRHVAFGDLGLLAPVMEREGWDVSFCEAAVDDLLHESNRNPNAQKAGVDRVLGPAG